MNNIYKPGECMKYMYVEMHPALLETWYCSDVKREVALAGAKVSPDNDICDLALVLWSRALQPELASYDGQVQLTPRKERCDRALYVLCAEDISEHVAQHSLSKHVAQVKDMVACAITLVIFGTKEYFKSCSRRTQNSNRKLMTEIELEMAITDLIVTAGCDAAVVDSPNELALLIAQFTKALAEAPHKKSKRESDEQAEFFMRGDNKQCITIDNDGNGMHRLWQQMVAVLPMSSLETSRAICTQYKTPRSLYEALKSSNAVNTVADIGVARAAVPGSITRRVGPEFARKLHILFTSDDGSALID